MKYVIFAGEAYGCPILVPVLFPRPLVHAEVAQGVCHRSRQEARLLRPISAGFVDIGNGKATAHGESESMGLKAHPSDSGVLSAFLFQGAEGIPLAAQFKQEYEEHLDV